MPQFCPIAFSCLNIITLLLCASTIAVSVFKLLNGTYDMCLDTNYSNTLKMSIAMSILSILGLIGQFGRVKILLRIYIGVMLIICLALVATLQIGFYATHTSEGREAEYIKGDDYRLEHFSERAQRIFLNRESWSSTKKCLKRRSVCKSYVEARNKMSSYDLRAFHPLQGCCKPPKKCGYRQINGTTYWEVPKTGLKSDEKDCMQYRNGEELCYDCDACKAAYIAVQLGDRFQLTVSTITWIIFCICALILSCSTLTMLEKSQGSEVRAKKNNIVSTL